MRMRNRWLLLSCAVIALSAALPACSGTGDTTSGGAGGGGGETGGAGGNGNGGSGGSAGGASACAEGPITLPTNTGRPCTPEPDPQCPAQPSGASALLISVSTCAFGKDETDCEPVVSPTCPQGMAVLSFAVINPDVGPGCAGEFSLEALPNAGGGVDIHWSGYEQDPMTCAMVGPDLMGSESLPGLCCATTFDVHYPAADFTFRVRVQSDWQP
jgi:hypothetical protein